jgi:F-type H+-transporting ATPase subunit b
MADTPVEQARAGGAGMPQRFLDLPEPDFLARGHARRDLPYFVPRGVATDWRAVLAERQGTITNDIAAAEELKQRAIEAEAAYDKTLGCPFRW